MSQSPTADPRVYFAAERTLLAWVRTGITVIALGFVVARFGLFLDLLAHSNSGIAVHSHHGLSTLLGILLVITGACISLGAHYNHRCYILQLPTQDIPAVAIPWLTPLLTLAICMLGILLAIYLTFT